MNVLNTYSEFDFDHFDLSLDHYGSEVCDKGYSFGPTVREDYVLHFIVHGQGSFTIQSKTVSLRAGDMFLLPKDQITFYQADFDKPWTYLWVGFSGSRAESILQETSLLDNCYAHSHLDSKILKQLQQLLSIADQIPTAVSELLLIGELYQLLAYLTEELPKSGLSASHRQTKHYIAAVKKIIHTHYNSPLRVADIASRLNLNRSYLYKIFKKETGTSIKDYLLQVRMNRSAQLLRSWQLSISEVAASVGFTDALAFSKYFKRFFGQSPSSYRKANKPMPDG